MSIEAWVSDRKLVLCDYLESGVIWNQWSLLYGHDWLPDYQSRFWCKDQKCHFCTTLSPESGLLGLWPKKKKLLMLRPRHWGQERSEVDNQTVFRTDRPRVKWPPLPLLVIKALREPPRERKKQKTTKYTKHKLANTAWVMWPGSLVREVLGTIKDILGNSLSVGWSRNAYYTHDLINDIKSCTEMPHDWRAEEEDGETTQSVKNVSHTHENWAQVSSTRTETEQVQSNCMLITREL